MQPVPVDGHPLPYSHSHIPYPHDLPVIAPNPFITRIQFKALQEAPCLLRRPVPLDPFSPELPSRSWPAAHGLAPPYFPSVLGRLWVLPPDQVPKGTPGQALASRRSPWHLELPLNPAVDSSKHQGAQHGRHLGPRSTPRLGSLGDGAAGRQGSP